MNGAHKSSVIFAALVAWKSATLPTSSWIGSLAVGHRTCSIRVTPRPCRAASSDVVGLALDLETTGGNTKQAQICQFAIVHVNSDTPKNPLSFSRYVLPEHEMASGVVRVHGLTRDRLIARGAKCFRETWEECEQWLESTFGSDQRYVWAAHNGACFDWPVLRRHVPHASVLQPPRGVLIDTLPMARAVASRGSSCDLAALYWQASQGNAIRKRHDALADALALARVWRWLIVKRHADPNVASEFQHHLRQQSQYQSLRVPDSRQIYAVRAGREPGLYDSWGDRQKQVLRFPKAEYKKFKSRDEAHAWLIAMSDGTGVIHKGARHIP
eukprot:TRINITY_DN90307_c0_g1_i1.p1 TRINITY_DN90307_c0_g1~~TRINITY_DN90307_c0_g1_i1.p1  ORF type:complete len:327 (-),score=29.83 TRINITY_DN90307_c0_g1_i1:153-1133(-)